MSAFVIGPLLKQPAYSPHLAPSDYHMLLNLIKHLKGVKFSTIEDAMYAGLQPTFRILSGWFKEDGAVEQEVH